MASKEDLLAEIETLKQQLHESKSQAQKATKEVTYIAKEKRLETFSGEGKDVREWIDECRDVIDSARFNSDQSQKVSFILRHLQGKAKSEVKIHGKCSNPEEIFTILRKAFCTSFCTEKLLCKKTASR